MVNTAVIPTSMGVCGHGPVTAGNLTPVGMAGNGDLFGPFARAAPAAWFSIRFVVVFIVTIPWGGKFCSIHDQSLQGSLGPLLGNT